MKSKQARRNFLKLLGLTPLAFLNPSLDIDPVKAQVQPEVVTNTGNTFSNTITPLGSAGTVTLPPGPVPAGFDCITSDELAASVFTDQAGTLFVEASQDNATFRVADSVPVYPNLPVNRVYAVTTRYMRLRYINGNNAQTVFEMSAALR